MTQAGNDKLIVDRYEASAKLADSGPNSYRNLRIHALPGLHPFIGDLARKHLAPGGTTLDVAGGSGAMALRLSDAGFEVEATDYVSANFKLHGTVPFTQANLNHDFAALFPHRYDAIVASEIVEHLENPRHFARGLFELLKPGGRLLISTPNIDSMPSKALFLSCGRFLWFEDQQYSSDGHMTPLSQWQVNKVFAEAGFRMLEEASFGQRFERLQGSPRLRLLIRALGAVFGSVRLGGEIYLAVFERPLTAP